MKPLILKKEVLKVTLKSIDKTPANWVTFNDKMHTKIINQQNEMESNVRLDLDEIPILECVLSDSFLLISTKRIISSVFDKYYEMLIKDILDFSNEFEKENHQVINGQRPKTNLMELNGTHGQKLFFKIDSYYPAFFVKILIYNLSNQYKYKDWYLDPSNEPSST